MSDYFSVSSRPDSSSRSFSAATDERRQYLEVLTLTAHATNEQNSRTVFNQIQDCMTAPLRNLPLDHRDDECLLRVATRPSPLRIHRLKAVSDFSAPKSGRSSLSIFDPKPPLSFLQSGRSAKRDFCATEFYKAAIGDLKHPAISPCSQARKSS